MRTKTRRQEHQLWQEGGRRRLRAMPEDHRPSLRPKCPAHGDPGRQHQAQRKPDQHDHS